MGTVRPGYRVVQRLFKKSGNIVSFSEDAEEIEVRELADGVPVATVSYRNGITLQLKPFESASASVSVTLPTYLEEYEEARELATSLGEEWLELEVEKIKTLRKSMK